MARLWRDRTVFRQIGLTFTVAFSFLLLATTPAAATQASTNVCDTLSDAWVTLLPEDFCGMVPYSLAVAPDDTVYSVDAGGGRVLQFSQTGELIRQWGTEGSDNGQFRAPMGIAVDPTGDVYVADTGNDRIQQFTGAGTFVRKWGSSGNGVGQMAIPTGIATAPDGSIYVSDYGNGRVQQFTGMGSYVRQWGGDELFGGLGFDGVSGIATNATGDVYVTDQLNYRIVRFTSTGAFQRQWGFTGGGTGNGWFNEPKGVAVDSTGDFYVADTVNNRVQWFDRNAFSAYRGQWGSDGAGDGDFHLPAGIAINSSGQVYVADTGNQRIQHFGAAGSYLGKWGSLGSDEGSFRQPSDVAVNTTGDVYVADSTNHRIQQLTPAGTFVRKWGSLGAGDGQFDTPSAVAVDASGDVYVADRGNSRIQQFTPAGLFVRSWGSYGVEDGQLWFAADIAVAPDGSLYVTDGFTSRVQQFTATGSFIRKWGSDGTGDAELGWGSHIAVSSSGDVYVADAGNSRIQQFTSVGTFTHKWGSSGTGNGQFGLGGPGALAFAPDGTLYVTDTGNHRVQRFTSTGSYISKWGAQGAADGRFNAPSGVDVNATGDIYVADTQNHRIQLRPFDAAPPDATAPTTTLSSSPASYNGDNGWFKSSPVISLSRNEAGTTRFQWGGTDDGSWSAYSGTPVIAATGSRTIYYRSVDLEGNTEDIRSRLFKVDPTPPTAPSGITASHSPAVPSADGTIRVTWPAAGIAGGASDAISGIDGYSFSFTTESTSVPDTVKDAEQTATEATSASLPSGDYYFHMRAKDNAGNWSTTVHKGPFRIDVLPPSVAFGSGSPTAGSYIRGTVTVVANAADTGGSAIYAAYLYSPYTQKGLDASYPYTFFLDTSTLSDGAHTLRLRSKDKAGSYSTYASRSVHIDNHRPRTSAPKAASVLKGGYVRLYYGTNDPYTDYSNVRIIIKKHGTTVKTVKVGWKKSGNYYKRFLASIPRGTYYFYIHAIDRAGNSQYNKARNRLTVK